MIQIFILISSDWKSKAKAQTTYTLSTFFVTGKTLQGCLMCFLKSLEELFRVD